MFTFKKTIRDAEHFLSYLRSNGFNASGVAVTGTMAVSVEPMPGEAKNPTQLVSAYVPRDYYEFAASRAPESIDILGTPTYVIKRNGVDEIAFTITKKGGATDLVKPDGDRIDIHWHGARISYVSEKVVTLVGGYGKVTMGRVWVPGGGILEAVHPQEGARRAAAFIRYEP